MDHQRRSSLAELARHLIDIGLVTPADVHQAGFVARNAGMSHAVAVVTLGDGRGYVVKELLPPRDQDQGTPEQERAIYRLASTVDALAPFVARLIHLGEGGPFIVLALEADSQTVAQRASLTGWSDGELARQLGRAIGTWHDRSGPFRADVPHAPTPWVLRALDTDRPAFLQANAWVAQFLDTDVDRALQPILADVAATLSSTAVIHGDLRFDNCLIDPAGRITFVDWESGGAGDPLWDVAALTQELLSASRARDAASSGPVLSGAIRLLLEAYRGSCRSAEWTGEDGLRLARLTGARLLQRSLQLAARGVPELDAERDRHLALARVLLTDQAIATWLTMPARSAAA